MEVSIRNEINELISRIEGIINSISGVPVELQDKRSSVSLSAIRTLYINENLKFNRLVNQKLK